MHTPLSRDALAARVAQELIDGSCVNLGIGLPTLVADHVLADREVVLHAENGILGVGPGAPPGEEDWDLIDAGKRAVTLVPGAAYTSHTDSFALIRGGHLDVAILGAYQVSERGDLANWATSDTTYAPAVGGAMDLAVGARRVLVMTKHQQADGSPKILRECTLPLTAAGVVDRIFTDLAVLDVGDDGLEVVEMVPGLSFDELQDRTGARLRERTRRRTEPAKRHA